MSKTNYNKMTNKPKEDIKKKVEAVIENTEVAAEAPKVEEENTKFIICTVTNCERLNIRKNPSLSAEVLCTVAAKTKVEVFPDEAPADKEWSSVVTESGIEGYCMTKYLSKE